MIRSHRVWILESLGMIASLLASPGYGASPAEGKYKACISRAKTDSAAEKEVRACYDEYEHVITDEKDSNFKLAYRRDFFAHDNDMLTFYERRQIAGWDGGLAAYYHLIESTAAATSNIIASTGALAGSSATHLEIANDNVRVKARGDLAFVLANRSECDVDSSGGRDCDAMRITQIFERREGRWVSVHTHASFQAPPGPQRPTPLVTDPTAKLWDPILEGAWKTEGDGFLVASAGQAAFWAVPGLPARAGYKISHPATRIELIPLEANAKPISLEIDEFDSAKLVFRISGESKKWEWHRTEW